MWSTPEYVLSCWRELAHFWSVVHFLTVNGCTWEPFPVFYGSNMKDHHLNKEHISNCSAVHLIFSDITTIFFNSGQRASIVVERGEERAESRTPKVMGSGRITQHCAIFFNRNSAKRREQTKIAGAGTEKFRPPAPAPRLSIVNVCKN